MRTWLSALLLLILMDGFAGETQSVTGLFFNTVSSGERLIITTRVPNHPQPYPQAGIQILTKGYVLTDPASECSSYNSRTGMCIFSVGNTEPKVISITSTGQIIQGSDIVTIKLCLDGVRQLTCQHYTHRDHQHLTTQRAYVVSSGQNQQDQGYVSVCELLNNGAHLGLCVESASPNLVSPQAITFNALGDMAYLTNFGDGSVTNCAINPVTGLFESCHKNLTGIPTPSSNPSGESIVGAVAVGPNHVYVPNYSGQNIQVWSLNADGSFKTMVQLFSDPAFSMGNPNSITLDPAGSYVYIANSTQNAISVCPVLFSGKLGTCTNSTDPVNIRTPLSVSFDVTGTKVYIANAGDPGSADDSVAYCSLTGSAITGCSTNIPTMNTFNFGAAYGPNPSGAVANIFVQGGGIIAYGYVPNAATNEISICPLTGGALGMCDLQTNPQFITPAGVAVNSIGSV